MSKNMQACQRDHFNSKINRKLDPLIEQETLLLKSVITNMTSDIEKSLAKKIGAEKIIAGLDKAEKDLEIARRRARSFFENTSKKNQTYKANKNWYSEGDSDFSKINVRFCINQIGKWAKALAEEEVEKTDAGKKLVHLRALKENCQDQVMEASVSGDLKESLNHVLKTVGLQWNASYIPLAKPKK
tara:strand:- start:301 stop:858 length:558 start_codon:yes stop_codon:yes gene_type:complete